MFQDGLEECMTYLYKLVRVNVLVFGMYEEWIIKVSYFEAKDIVFSDSALCVCLCVCVSPIKTNGNYPFLVSSCKGLIPW